MDNFTISPIGKIGMQIVFCRYFPEPKSGTIVNLANNNKALSVAVDRHSFKPLNPLSF